MPNYYDSAYGSDFSDASGSALLAAAAYRLATTGHDPSHVSSADTVRSAVFGGVNSTTGWLSPVVVRPGASLSTLFVSSVADRRNASRTRSTSSIRGPSRPSRRRSSSCSKRRTRSTPRVRVPREVLAGQVL